MKKQFLQLFLICLLVFAGGVATATVNSATSRALTPEAISKQMAALRVPFIRNQGQIANADVAFYAQTFAGAGNMPAAAAIPMS